MRTQRWNRLVVLALAGAVTLAVVFVGPPAGRVAGQNLGLTRDFHFSPVGVTNRQVVTMQCVNNFTGPITVGMEIYGSKVNGTTWDPGVLLAAQKATVLAPGQGILIALDWNAVGGLANGERAQVWGRLHVTTNADDGGETNIASLQVSDPAGLLPPGLADPRPDPVAVLGTDPITKNFQFDPAIVTNRQVVRMAYANPGATPVRITMEILGGKATGNMANAGAVLAAQRDLLVGPGQGILIALNWNAIGGLANGERAQVWGRLQVNGVVDPSDKGIASLQISDLLGLVPTRAIDPSDKGAR